MKIAMIGAKGLPAKFGGIETHVAEISTRLIKAGYEVVVYARNWYTEKEIFAYNGIQIIRVPSFVSPVKATDGVTNVLLATLHAVFFLKPDIYHFHGVGPALFAWLPRIFASRAKVIVTVHALDKDQAKWPEWSRKWLELGERATTVFAHEVIVVSRYLQRYFKDRFGVIANYLPNGVNPVRVVTDYTVLTPFSLQPHDYILMVSRLVRHKSAQTMISAWQEARKSRPNLFTGLKLAIVGGSAATDDYVAELKEQIADDDSIVMTGFQSGSVLSGLFAGARFVVHPSTMEGLPIAVLEGMSYGKAVIAADIPANREAVGEQGLTFAPGDIAQLAKAIVYFLETPKEVISRGHMSRVFVEDAYNWEEITAGLKVVYKGAVKSWYSPALLDKAKQLRI